jgi:hypothetical protein
LSEDAIGIAVWEEAMSARTADNPAKQIREWMSAFCAVRKGFCPDDWYRFALAAFGYEWIPPPAPNAVFPDSKSRTGFSDAHSKETPKPAPADLPFKGFETWKALFDGVCFLLSNGLDSVSLWFINTNINNLTNHNHQSTSDLAREVYDILPMFEPPGVDTLARALSNPSLSQRTLDTLLGDMLNVMSLSMPDTGVPLPLKLEQWRLGWEGGLSKDTSPLMAGVTLLHMRGAMVRAKNHYHKIDNELAKLFRDEYIFTTEEESPNEDNSIEDSFVENVKALLHEGANPMMPVRNTMNFSFAALTWVVMPWDGQPKRSQLIKLLLDNWHADMPAARNTNVSPKHQVRERDTKGIFKLLRIKTVVQFETDTSENNRALIEQFIGMLVPWIASLGRIVPIATSCISELARELDAFTTENSTKPAWLLDKWSEVLEETKRELGMLGEESDSPGAPHNV